MRDFPSNSHLAQLIAKFDDASAVVAIVGLGYRMLKYPFRSMSCSSRSYSGGRAGKATLRIGRLLCGLANGCGSPGWFIVVSFVADQGLAALRAWVRAPGKIMLRLRCQLASGEAATYTRSLGCSSNDSAIASAPVVRASSW